MAATDETSGGVAADDPVAPVSFLVALRFWLYLGCVGFGGPAGQIAIMHRELVERRRWISEHRFLHALNYCMVLPGPEAIQLATYIGWLLHRTRGGIAAGGLFLLPSLVLLIALSWVYMAFGDTTVVEGLFAGVKPAIAVVVVHAARRIGKRAIRSVPLAVLAAAAFVAIVVFSVPFPLIVVAAALIGWLGGRVAPERFAGEAHRGSERSYGPALIDDETPIPEHARFRFGRLARVAAVGAVLWAVPFGALIAVGGWNDTLSRMGWFFTTAALLSFGGAYAVLPYVAQGAVDQFGWLTPGQMIDGLALGETTPGPLIMVVTFVGFVGGWATDGAGGVSPAVAGVVAALVVTWFTFLPSFLFILGGGPLVERTRGEARLTAPLMAITAAVVGVIASLAIYFGYHALWPTGFDGGVGWSAVAITVGAAVALFRLQRSVIEVIAVAALVGLLLEFAT